MLNNIKKTNRIKVMVIDDSAVVRQVMTGILESDPALEVIGACADPIYASQRMQPEVELVHGREIIRPHMGAHELGGGALRLAHAQRRGIPEGVEDEDEAPPFRLRALLSFGAGSSGRGGVCGRLRPRSAARGRPLPACWPSSPYFYFHLTGPRP